MIHVFAGYQLDTEKCELRSSDALIPVEPQVFALLRLLIENRERLVGKDEIVERIWKGRIVSDAAIASRVKSARRAIGDDGGAQRMIRTLHRLGFRFVGEVKSINPAKPAFARAAAEKEIDPPGGGEIARPSIAVLPFTLVGVAGSHGEISDSLPHDLIVELSRLRWLFVIARGSSFQFRGTDAKFDRVKAVLGARYCLSGVVEIDNASMIVRVELCDTDDGGIVWSETFRADIAAVHEIRAEIVHSVVNALELRIPLNEARRARLRSPENLDAWSAYHLGLNQMYRFCGDGNARAQAFFERAIAMEPTFARAHAGLSFTHFESAFLNLTDDLAEATKLARQYAEQSLEHDPFDPFCNLVMGRASWLGGDLEASVPWLDRAVELNPNYAQGKYSRAWAVTLLGRGVEGQADVDAALELSPLDPLLYGMLGVRAFSHMVLDQPAQSARWADRAARAPRAHPLIEMIAAVAHGLNADEERANFWARSARNRRSGLGAAEFFRAFPFRDPSARERIAETLARLKV